jgi:hypothetical protein
MPKRFPTKTHGRRLVLVVCATEAVAAADDAEILALGEWFTAATKEAQEAENRL